MKWRTWFNGFLAGIIVCNLFNILISIKKLEIEKGREEQDSDI
ncbi:MAG TPA: hypothetical protein PKV16_08585 [Caldisericia bacterium]|nr:hypothetical protein [Caldisericia bacterium]HPF49341.1 hypothetical protein [Caldisericia bacterium]HPI84417.1 hypothetical protein [Caldisericia bacterium]HPQ93822.1 hypothetical protein [Caldisericia bacterium]HRV75614.1 hypothetical protein [Caldisericia bacterium]